MECYGGVRPRKTCPPNKLEGYLRILKELKRIQEALVKRILRSCFWMLLEAFQDWESSLEQSGLSRVRLKMKLTGLSVD